MNVLLAHSQQIRRCSRSSFPGKQPVRGKLTSTTRQRPTCAGRRRKKLETSLPSQPFGRAVSALLWGLKANRKQVASGLRVTCLFEKFTEQAIAAIMRSQAEAKHLGAREVKIWLPSHNPSVPDHHMQAKNRCSGRARTSASRDDRDMP